MPRASKSGNERNKQGLCFTKYCTNKNLSKAKFFGQDVLFCPACKEKNKYLK
ncbi:hypothetical protein SEA_ENYGMA_35 [Streptomyces phage Enygma]